MYYYRLFGVLLLISSITGSYGNSVVKEKVCLGTNYRFSVTSNRDVQYNSLKDRFTNCTYVDGNLELTWLDENQQDLTFLEHIREVSGYVLISHMDLQKVILPRLQIIRGRTLLKVTSSEEEFALIVTLSKMFSLELPALRDVLRGNVGFFNNYNLCYQQTINWNEIISDPEGRYFYHYNYSSPERECPPCHKNCVAGCWGEGEENCQKFSKENCSPHCNQGRCFGIKPRECCHQFCAGGCTGPKPSDCIACKNFNDDGVCRDECPSLQVYNPLLYSFEPNPEGKYASGMTCVKKCPPQLLRDNGACVKACPSNKKAVRDECLSCGGDCPKVCKGDVTVNSDNINSFQGCTLIDGSIYILQTFVTGYQELLPNFTFGAKYTPMHPDRLEVFNTVKEITGFVNIQLNHPDFKNLSYFRNLEIIGGRTLFDHSSSLYIIKTSLESLNLHSLKSIISGTVAILENDNLCFAESLNWTAILKSSEHSPLLHHNRNAEQCDKSGLICDEQCNEGGCWGKGADQCLGCLHFRLDHTCLQTSTAIPGVYLASDNGTCGHCHEECDPSSSCNGPEPNHCAICKHFRDGVNCVSKCPSSKYGEKGKCQECHSNCVGGCTGPTNTVGPGGCNSCENAIIHENATIANCLDKNESCPDGYFYQYAGPYETQHLLKSLIGKVLCRKCHSRCKRCTSYGFHESVCQECRNYKKGEQCEDQCPLDTYPDDDSKQCFSCDKECRECTGAGPTNCVNCRNFRVYADENILNGNRTFRCESECPPEFPLKVFPERIGDPYCSADPKQQF